MKILCNGKELELQPAATVTHLLGELGLDRPYALDRVSLEEGDRIVVARPVAGG